MLEVSGFSGIGTSLAWYCDPKLWAARAGTTEGTRGGWDVEGGELVLRPPSKKDFWRKTYYEPLLCKDDGACLFAEVPEGEAATVETEFTLTPKRQFDQAGLCARLDCEHWIKTGIEVVDGSPRLSCVVTNGYSDWSTQSWKMDPSGDAVSLRIRMSKMGSKGAYVVEASEAGGSELFMIRICHMARSHGCTGEAAVCEEGPPAPDGKVWMGVFGCCPEEQEGGCVVRFRSFSARGGTSFHHNAEGNAADGEANGETSPAKPPPLHSCAH